MTNEQSMEHLMQAAVDGRLTRAQRDRLETYLADRPEERARLREMIRQNELLQRALPEPSPRALERMRRAAQPAPGQRPVRRLAAALAIFAIGVGAGQFLPRDSGSETPPLARQGELAAAAHALYSPEVLHPVEVSADQRDHLQTWLTNRLGAPVIVPELGNTGFRLVGGRLLPAGHGPAAFFMYENEAGERLSLFANLAPDSRQTSFQYRREGELGIVTWQDGRWRYSVVGPVARPRIEAIARRAHEELI